MVSSSLRSTQIILSDFSKIRIFFRMMKPRIPRDFLYYFPYGLEYLLHLNKIFVDYGEWTRLYACIVQAASFYIYNHAYIEQMTDTLFESIVKNENGEKIYHALDGKGIRLNIFKHNTFAV